MSRHIIPALPDAGEVEVTVGWDPPMNTFFAMVADLRAGEDESGELLWVGTRYSEIHDLRKLGDALAPWAEIPADVERALYSEAHS